MTEIKPKLISAARCATALESFTLSPAALQTLAANLFRHAGTARMVVKAED